jgi:cobalt/nickel transport system permease protein
MHISEGILSPPVLAGGALLAAGGVAAGLKKMEDERIPQVAILTSAFFVASLIHIPVGPSHVHLVLNGLAGILLGWTAFPAFLVALFLQALLFQFGGLSVLGVNTVILALPAAACAYLIRPMAGRVRGGGALFAAGFLGGMLAVALSGFMMSFALFTTGKAFTGIAVTVLAAYLPVMALEGVVTGFILVFLKQVRPEILGGIRE